VLFGRPTHLKTYARAIQRVIIRFGSVYILLYSDTAERKTRLQYSPVGDEDFIYFSLSVTRCSSSLAFRNENQSRPDSVLEPLAGYLNPRMNKGHNFLSWNRWERLIYFHTHTHLNVCTSLVPVRMLTGDKSTLKNRVNGQKSEQKHLLRNRTMYVPRGQTFKHGRVLGEGRRGDRPPESVFEEPIISEIHISDFFNMNHFITKANYACPWILN
jgi:hypothetical protein